MEQPTFWRVNVEAVRVAAVGAAVILGAALVLDLVCRRVAELLVALGVGT